MPNVGVFWAYNIGPQNPKNVVSRASLILESIVMVLGRYPILRYLTLIMSFCFGAFGW